MKDQVIVITGASSGIGAALAGVAGGRGARPVLVARREKELGEVASRCGPEALAVVADVTRLTRLVSELTDDDFDEMMLVNAKSALYGMQAVLPHFRERGRGHIINVSSMLGRVPFAPVRSAYSAAKHALNALTANLRMELRAQNPGIVVSSVHPGVVATDFGRKARHGGLDSRQLPGAQSVEEVAEVIAGLIDDPRADVYTRPGARELVVGYHAADDMGRREQEPPFVSRGAPGRP